MSEVDILRYLVGALIAVSLGVGGALITVVVWIGQRAVAKIDELGERMGSFDRRVTRLESRSSWHLHSRANDR